MKPTERDFWDFIAAREEIRIKKERGDPWPWSESEIFTDYRFCNIRRADDRGTRYYVENIGLVYMQPEDLVFRTIAYRLINNITWWEKALPINLSTWRSDRWGSLKRFYAAGPPSSPAYLTFGGGQAGASHLEQFAESLDWMEALIVPFTEDVLGGSIESAWKVLQQVPFVGPFVAGQIYRDLILAGTPLASFDENNFTVIGPGAKMGLTMLYGKLTTHMQMMYLVTLQQSPKNTFDLVLPDIQHSMCEARKFWRIKNWLDGTGPRPKIREYVR